MTEQLVPLLALEADLAHVGKVADALLPYLDAGTWFFLEGDLGAGKTTLVQQHLARLDALDESRSPTFSLLNTIPLGEGAPFGLSRALHLDLYRLKSGRELCYLGLETAFDRRSLALFEWASLVEPEDWEEFFSLTGCPRPARLFALGIGSLAGSRRRYVLSEISPSDVFAH